MARYKPYDLSQRKLIPISFEAQILPASFEHTLSRLIDPEPDLSVFDQKRNNKTGASRLPDLHRISSCPCRAHTMP